jgi:hypothetical protein
MSVDIADIEAPFGSPASAIDDKSDVAVLASEGQKNRICDIGAAQKHLHCCEAVIESRTKALVERIICAPRGNDENAFDAIAANGGDRIRALSLAGPHSACR